ncbi:putative anti-sigma regulatory factor, serine/threonine protein kinase [Catenulispora acidiphila DSM 44928]|uniref:Putative anti-sigma regulatory factor, serine/threonine protein kinase n=1 Tax=Catenulispora acidiphila (strain DSM 44928 / JCM 14897 / NBRC 102108 / NRRL B-24433 / ID139908) TaxID=479433 RepID=C7Q2P7_CATAD|nr:ATP-binding protein [Catenulispora acidiphila]ACU71789.1 putative anti-sigma regulatory factor, serine/threonine protein kinase [Catenulispora acidiphila DSM 44928]
MLLTAIPQDRPVADSPLYDEITLPRVLQSVRDTRHWLDATLAGWDVPADTVENATLVVSEITTNALVHNAGLGDMIVTAAWWHGHLRITVSDPDLQIPVPDLADDEHGRGLLIVGDLATRWGRTKTRTGKITWFELTAEVFS